MAVIKQERVSKKTGKTKVEPDNGKGQEKLWLWLYAPADEGR